MPSTIAPEIRIARASLTYGDAELFASLDVMLNAGETTCLLGHSGVGKTSLLRLIAGLEQSATGQVTAGDGKPVSPRVAYMAQQDLLFPWLSALDNVLIGARLRGEPVDRGAAVPLLERLGLGRDLDKRPAALSGGMRQRVALARTLMEDRPVVLMDEPFSALDALTRMELQALAAEQLRGRTVLLVTHDAFEAVRLADQIYVMTGRPATLKALPAPSGKPPRSPEDEALLKAQAALLHELLRRDSAA